MNIKKWIVAIITGSALTLSACGGQNKGYSASTPPNADKVYRVVTNAEFAPFESINADNQIEGFDIDLLNAMAEAGNFKVEYKHQPWESLFPALRNGDADIVIAAVSITDERKQTMDFTEPYFKITQVILVPKGKNIYSVKELQNAQKVGVATGQVGDLVVSKILGHDSQKIARFESLPLVIKELENGGLDAVVSDSAALGNYLKNNNSREFRLVTVPDFEEESYGIAVRKGDHNTLNMLNNALAKIQQNGEYDKVYNRYFVQ